MAETLLAKAIQSNSGPIKQDFWFGPETLDVFKKIRQLFWLTPTSVRRIDSDEKVDITPRILTGTMARIFELPIRSNITMRISNHTQQSNQEHLIHAGCNIIVWGQYTLEPRLIHWNDPVLKSFYGGIPKKFDFSDYTELEFEVIQSLSEILGNKYKTRYHPTIQTGHIDVYSTASDAKSFSSIEDMVRSCRKDVAVI
jgi:hypothetical protein